MEISALLTAVQGLPATRQAPATAQLDPILLVAGVEIARADQTDEAKLRRVWRERHGGGATPLLVLAEDPGQPEVSLALGPIDGSGPIRRVATASIHDLVVRISQLPRLHAVRELTAELDRLDQAGIPGLKVQDLLTVHTLDVRLRDDAARWQRLGDAAADVPRRGTWQQILAALGYDVERRPDRGALVRHHGAPVAVVHPKADPADFSRLDSDGRPPEGVLVNDCAREGCAYGLMVSGSRLRLLAVRATAGGSATGRYLDLDAGQLADADRPFLGLLGPAWLAEGGLVELEEESRAFGGALRKALDERLT